MFKFPNFILLTRYNIAGIVLYTILLYIAYLEYIFKPTLTIILVLHLILRYTTQQRIICDLIGLIICTVSGLYFSISATFDKTIALIALQLKQVQQQTYTFNSIIHNLSNWDNTLNFSLLLTLPLVCLNLKNYFTYNKHCKHYENSQQIVNYTTDNVQNIPNSTKIGFSNNTPTIITDQELNQHCLIVGTTGSGKTTTILNFVESAASRNIPVVYLDGKGSPDLIDKLAKIAKQNNKIFKVFTLRPNENIEHLAGYNPFSSGGATEWKNRIMSLFAQVEGKGQEHFSLGEQNFINFVANVLAKFAKQNNLIDLRILLAFIEHPSKLIAVANKIDPVTATKLSNLYEKKEIEQLTGDIIKLLELFIYSDYGKLFNTSANSKVINLKESIQSNEIVLFLFDASAYKEDTNKVAKMVINDLNSCFASVNMFTKCYCIFDEFASYASNNLAETISLHRSNGLHAIIGTQSITTVKLKSNETKRIAEELIACCNTYIVQTLNHTEDVEIMSKTIGTRKTYEVTTQIDNKKGGQTGLGSIKYIDEFKIHPQTLKELKTGEAIIYNKVSKVPPSKIIINTPTMS